MSSSFLPPPLCFMLLELTATQAVCEAKPLNRTARMSFQAFKDSSVNLPILDSLDSSQVLPQHHVGRPPTSFDVFFYIRIN